MFDTALLESRADRKGRGKGAGLPLAIGLHVAVIGAFVGASVWSVGEPPEPVIPVRFFAPPAAPPPPRGDGGHVRETTHAAAGCPHPRRRPSRCRPTRSPRSTSLRAGRPGLSRGRTPAARRAIRNGVDDGTGDVARRSNPGRNPCRSAGRRRRRAGAGPALAARARLPRGRPARAQGRGGHPRGGDHGRRRGRGRFPRILRSANPLLDAAAERAVRQWRYRAGDV